MLLVSYAIDYFLLVAQLKVLWLAIMLNATLVPVFAVSYICSLACLIITDDIFQFYMVTNALQRSYMRSLGYSYLE
jgi:hypothetical protein